MTFTSIIYSLKVPPSRTLDQTGTPAAVTVRIWNKFSISTSSRCCHVSSVSYLKGTSSVTINDTVLSKGRSTSTTVLNFKVGIEFQITQNNSTTVSIYTKDSVSVGSILNECPSTKSVSTACAVKTKETNLAALPVW